MTESNPSVPSSASSAWDNLDDILEQFEYAWRHGSSPNIDAYLKQAAIDPQILLPELAHSDLVFRLKAGEAARVEGYFERYPELAADRKWAIDLIETEYKLRRGREPELTPDEFLQRFPQYREDLAERFPGPHRPKEWAPAQLNCPHCRQLVTLQGDTKQQEISCSACGHSFRVDGSPLPSDPPIELTQLDQFQMLDVVGQGSFGTVYRARDTQLERIVAVKVPRGLRGTSGEADRFLREARNAAQLVHAGIVPVYAVGRAGTLPYIVSAFIGGRTLAEEMTRRQPRFREAADLVAQVARALAYAHGRGVVHRDLKPSNIMLGRVEESPRARDEDSSGEVRAFVMDFGLARRDEGEVRVTLDGQILGTPLYMSPEQARGEGHHADGRSDIYSLGVILYEMLTGEAPFRGTARMVFKQILEEEPRPPRRLNDKIPRDLETIALKCLAKEPERRYQTANDLAADLDRYLTDQPILARPVGRLERARRWTRRNPRLAALTGLVIGLVVFWIAGATVAAILINQQRQVAVQATSEATKAKLQAEEQRDRAEKQVSSSLKILYQIVQRLQEGIKNYPALNPWKERLLKIGLDGLEEVARTAHTSRGDRSQVTAHSRLGDIYLVIGKTAEARKQYEQSFALARAVHAANLDDDMAQRDLYLAYGKLAAVSVRMGETREARQFYHQALEIAHARVQAAPSKVGPKSDLIRTLNNLGRTSLEQGDDVKARQYFEEALQVAQAMASAHLDMVQARQDLVYVYASLGSLDLHSDRAVSALEFFQRGLELQEAIASAEPANFLAQIDLAEGYERVGDAYQSLGKFPAARDLLQKSLTTFQALAKVDPSHRAIQGGLARCYERLNRVNNLLGNFAAALDFAQKTLEKREELAAADPDNAQLQYGLVVTCYQVGQLAMLAHEFDRAARSYQRGLDILQRLLQAGKLANWTEMQRLRRVLKRVLPQAKIAPYAVENVTVALWGSTEGLPVVAASTVGLLGAAGGRGPWLAAAALVPGRAGSEDDVRELLQIRTAVLARRGQYADAAATAETLRAFARKNKFSAYNLGCAYAACVGALTQGKEASRLTPDEAALKEHYAGLAVAALNDAVSLGYNDVTHMITDRDLVPIFQEKGFRHVIERMKLHRWIEWLKLRSPKVGKRP